MSRLRLDEDYEEFNIKVFIKFNKQIQKASETVWLNPIILDK